MDLGIRGKRAIVCASSKGLGKGCAVALAEAGVHLAVNGRNADLLARTAAELRERFQVEVAEVAGDVSDPAVQKALLAACPNPDILVNNNGGPPRRDFRELDRKAILDGVTNNMVTPFELIKAVIDGMAERGFGRIVNITSLSVYQPIPGLDVSSGARAGLTSFLAEESGHRAHTNRHRRLHRPAAQLQEPRRLHQRQRPGRAQSGIFAKRVAGDIVRLLRHPHAAFFLQHA